MHADADGDPVPVGRELASDDGTGDVIEEGTSCIIITTTTIHKPEKNIFKERYSRDNCIVERTINEFASSRSVFFGNEAHETKSSVLHSRSTRYGSKQMSLRALYF